MQTGLDTGLAGTIASAQTDKLSRSVEDLARKARGGDAERVPQEFSKLLATMLVREMRQALPEGFFGEGAGSDVFEGWLDEHVGAALAARDGLRLEGMIAESLLHKDEAAKAAAGETGAAPAAAPTGEVP